MSDSTMERLYSRLEYTAEGLYSEGGTTQIDIDMANFHGQGVFRKYILKQQGADLYVIKRDNIKGLPHSILCFNTRLWLDSETKQLIWQNYTSEVAMRKGIEMDREKAQRVQSISKIDNDFSAEIDHYIELTTRALTCEEVSTLSGFNLNVHTKNISYLDKLTCVFMDGKSLEINFPILVHEDNTIQRYLTLDGEGYEVDTAKCLYIKMTPKSGYNAYGHKNGTPESNG